jgi:uncharacterized protein YcaQ
MTADSLSIGEARRLALSAQGFGASAFDHASAANNIATLIRRLGVVQLDFVNVLIPAHYRGCFSRLGRYELQQLGDVVYGSRAFTEQWAHEASVVPVETWPLLRHRREAFKPWSNSPMSNLPNKTKYLAQILDLIEEKGAITASDLAPVNGPRRRPGDWHRTVPRWALEYHFGLGRVAVANRLPNFQRVYDLPERLIPSCYREQRIDKHAAQRELLKLASGSSGIATLRDLADYYRMSVPEARPRVSELVEQGALAPVSVEGWTEPAYLSQGCRVPDTIECATLLSPFDPLVWCRPRAERLFDFHYRIEIYVPEAKRKWGYYVLPFLLDDRIVARVDLKADRTRRRLLVLAAHAEPGIDESRSCSKLAGQLLSIAGWLGLESVKVSRRGPFARRLHGELRARVAAP